MGGLRRCECGALPVVVAMPHHERMVALECPHCGVSTGYCVDPARARESWNRGDVAGYVGPLFELDGDPVQLTISETATRVARELEGDGDE